MDVTIKNRNGVKLLTAKKYCDEDINITLDLPRYDGSFANATAETLPSEYTQLTYIESTGEQYIDTEFNMTTTCEIDITMEVTEYNSSAKMGFLGSYETNSTLYQLYASGTGNKTFYGSFGGKNYTALSSFDINTVYNIVMQANTATINSVEYNFTSEGINDATKPLYLFWRNATAEKAKMKLYSCNIYNNSVAVRKFVPCTRVADGAVGLYDFIGEKFYENKGTGEFIGGWLWK